MEKPTILDLINRVIGTPEEREIWIVDCVIDPPPMPAYLSPGFTWEQAMNIQRRDLAAWKELLSPEAYSALETLTNNTTISVSVNKSSPYLVPRGEWLLNVVLGMMKTPQ